MGGDNMKKLYLIARNHMDPSWLRCFEESYTHPVTGETVRPYSDVEELQILEYMDFAEQYGVKYQIEQSLVVKKFLERNPDQAERFKSLVQEGLLELAGGGEAVIDCNLTQGESWARNHLYSRTYYRRTFGHEPKFAITPDIFGLPSQLPQFFRSLGYDALIIFDRVLKNNKPFWRGLDGTLIVLDSCFLQPPEPNLRTADCVKLPACGACGGKGCDLCKGTGIDTTYDMTRPDKELLQSAYYGNMSADVFLEKLLKTEKDEYFVMITTEEPTIGSHLYGPLADAAKRHDMQVIYLGFEENHEKWCPGQEERLQSGNYTEAEIDTRPEGNPAACGCYTSRIEIKKANRELEQLLFEAENLAVLARLHSGWASDAALRRDYPSKKLESLWNKMAFIQFHDCVTGTHVDAAYYELMRYIREVRRGALQIYDDAALELCRNINPEPPEGYYAAVCFNPTNFPMESPLLRLHAPTGTLSLEVTDISGSVIDTFDYTISNALVGVSVEFRAACTVPAFGVKYFYWRPSALPKDQAIRDNANYIENKYFRITVGDGEIAEIFDKANNRKMLQDGAASLAVGTDIGNPWGRTEPETNHRQLFADEIHIETTARFSRIILTGLIHEESKGIHRLQWTQTVTLINDEPLIRFHTDLDWNGKDTRVFASFRPAFRHTNKLVCEVPFGTMERDTPELINVLGLTDEWASLGFAGVTDGCYNIAVLKGGFAGTRLYNGKLQLSLLRAFSSDDPRYAETNDCGIHSSDYALTAWEGSFADGCCAARAARFLVHGHTLELTAPGKWIPPHLQAVNPCKEEESFLPQFDTIPENLRISALKWAEDGSGPVIRFWESAGVSATLKMPPNVSLQQCNTLEDIISDECVSEYRFRPFEIATFRVFFKNEKEDAAHA